MCTGISSTSVSGHNICTVTREARAVCRRTLGPGVTDGYDSPCGHWKFNPDLLEE